MERVERVLTNTRVWGCPATGGRSLSNIMDSGRGKRCERHLNDERGA